MTARVSQQAVEVLRACAVTTLFGNPGSTEINLFRHWPSYLRYVMALNEAAALAMADGYAQASGRAAVVNLHSSAGLGNALGMLVNARDGQSPLVIVAGQQTRSLLPDEPLLYAPAATQFPAPYVKWAAEPALPEHVPQLLARAIRIADTAPRGPVFLSVPADDWDAPAALGPGGFTQAPYTAEVADTIPDPGALDRLAEALRAAERPAFVVGAGVDSDAGWEVLAVLAEGLDAPVWCAPLAHRIGFPTAHPRFAGYLTPRPEAVRRALEDRDLVVVAGARAFRYHLPGDGPGLRPGSSVFVLTDAPDAPVPRGAAVLPGSPVEALRALGRSLGLGGGAPLPPSPLNLPPPRRKAAMSPDHVLGALARRLPRGTILVEEAPTHRDEIQEQIPITAPCSYFTCAAGGLGWGLPAAIGMGLAHPERKVVAILGDGACMYTIQALHTAARNGLPITVLVLNNGGYAAIRLLSHAGQVKLPQSACDLAGLDFTALAQAHGCAAGRVADAESLGDALDTALRCPGPYLLDIALDDTGADIYPDLPWTPQEVTSP